jgi:hypothetical protein
MGLAIAGLVYVVHGRGAPGVEQHNSTSSAVVESRMPLEDEVELVTRERDDGSTTRSSRMAMASR